MKVSERKRVFWVVRWRHRDDPDDVDYCINIGSTDRRRWAFTEKIQHAYEFPTKGDAKKAVHSSVAPLREHYYWEIVRIVETRATHWRQETVESDAPPLVQLARAELEEEQNEADE